MNIKTPAEADGSTNAWLADGEKYALIGLSLKLDGAPPGQLTPHLWALTGAAFSIPTHWQKWLGSIRVEEVEECNLFLLSKVASAKPGVVDAEDKMLQQRVMDFYVGLLLASPFAPAHPPVMLSGACEGTEIGIRQQQDLDAPIPCLVRLYPAVTPADIQLAARLSENLEALRAAQTQGGHWRLFRALNVYTAARTMGQIIDRIHQYCRAIDGLILSEPGNGKKQFRGRTELFIGARHHDLMGDVYDIRSAVEHLHEYRYLETFDRNIRLGLAKKAAIAEYIARTALARVIGEPALWPQFLNTPSLDKFWNLPLAERRKLWGEPVDPLEAVADFDPKFINDGQLGG
ncbi:MAG TPA: hypothetical protein VN750_19600 [Steroidobacteraceae bacterium]|nr:hypothetical protein [Steroidobacteraceae bacterium]